MPQSDHVMALTTRPATAADAPAIHGLVAACERHVEGSVDTDLDSIAADLARPALDVVRDTRLLFDSTGSLVGWAWVHLGRRAAIDVHPDHRGRGLGTRLLAWGEARAREQGSKRLGQNVMDGDAAAVALLGMHGYAPRATSWLLEIAMPEEPHVQDLPDGITIRPFRRGDESAVFRVTEDAFLEWPDRRVRSYDEWACLNIKRPVFAPDLSPLAFHGERLVAALLSLDFPESDEGYVHSVAVHRDYRNRGIARALLVHAFRGFHRQGCRRCVLWTHSDTGALSLYRKLGMTVRRSSTHFSKSLTDG